MKILIDFGEINKNNLDKYNGAFNLGSNLSSEIIVSYIAEKREDYIEKIISKKVKKIHLIDQKLDYSNISLTKIYKKIIDEENIDIILFTNVIKSLEIAPYLAQALNYDYIANVIKIKNNENTLETHRFIYGTKALEIGTYPKNKLIITVGINQDEKSEEDEILKSIDPTIYVYHNDTTLESNKNNQTFKILKREKKKKYKYTLEQAKIVIGVGKGLNGVKNLTEIESLAEILNAQIGASRSAVDNGWMEEELKIGQTGKIIKPDLYIALGISGAMQHMVGVKQARHIISINNNPNAEIFRDSDLGVVWDLFEIIRELKKLLVK